MPVQAYVLIRARTGKARNVAEAIAKVTGCRSVCTVTGRYDVIALLEAEDLRSLGDLIIQKTHTIDGVERTETALVV
ncbi:MAG: Lrp/AsnC ligand binding domain-containing protein [Nitrososphaerota archaeon]|nr:Lrp/AsnC ligand binding domain-containing protein [Candidatus Calditenuis fumarioli]